MSVIFKILFMLIIICPVVCPDSVTEVLWVQTKKPSGNYVLSDYLCTFAVDNINS